MPDSRAQMGGSVSSNRSTTSIPLRRVWKPIRAIVSRSARFMSTRLAATE
jgi:hypothetical protein